METPSKFTHFIKQYVKNKFKRQSKLTQFNDLDSQIVLRLQVSALIAQSLLGKALYYKLAASCSFNWCLSTKNELQPSMSLPLLIISSPLNLFHLSYHFLIKILSNHGPSQKNSKKLPIHLQTVFFDQASFMSVFSLRFFFQTNLDVQQKKYRIKSNQIIKMKFTLRIFCIIIFEYKATKDAAVVIQNTRRVKMQETGKGRFNFHFQDYSSLFTSARLICKCGRTFFTSHCQYQCYQCEQTQIIQMKSLISCVLCEETITYGSSYAGMCKVCRDNKIQNCSQCRSQYRLGDTESTVCNDCLNDQNNPNDPKNQKGDVFLEVYLRGQNISNQAINTLRAQGIDCLKQLRQVTAQVLAINQIKMADIVLLKNL